MNFRKILALSILAVGFSSCQLKITEEPSGNDEGSIFGDWSTNCMADGNDSYIKLYSIQEGSTSATFAAYYYSGDRFCNQANLDMTVIRSGTLTVNEDSSVSGAKNYEFQLASLFVAPGNNNAAAGLNAGTACGYSDWSKDSAKLIFGCFAPGAFDVSQVLPNTIDYGIFKIESSVSPNYMQFGTKCSVAGYEDICPTAQDQPSTLDGAVFYKIQ